MKNATLTLLLSAWISGNALAQEKKDMQPQWVVSHQLHCRPVGQRDFSPKNKMIAFEVYRHGAEGLFLTEFGGLAADSGFADVPVPVLKAKAALWLHRLEGLESRGGRRTMFSGESYHEEVLHRLIFVNDRGHLALGRARRKPETTDPPRKLTWLSNHPLERDSLDLYHNQESGHLLYLTAKGAMAVLHKPGKPLEKLKELTLSHRLEVPVRIADDTEEKLINKAKRTVEVFRDASVGAWVYVSNTGFIALSQGEKAKGKGARWLEGWVLKCRPSGETDFFRPLRFGVELYVDEHTGARLYVSQTGAIAIP